MKEQLTKITSQLTKSFEKVKRYRVVAFIVLLAVIYGFLVFRINSLSSQQPSDAEVSAGLKGSSSPHIDQAVVDKIQQLQDNSVQVKSLFSNARNSPFAE